MSDFERRIKFRPGYNYLHETGPKSRGQHGMEIAFALIGEEGAVSFEFHTMWTPLGVVDEGSTEAVHTDYIAGRYGSRCIHPPSGKAVFIHWRREFDSYLNGPDECHWLDGAPCWGDATYSGSDPILADFIKEGEDAVWRHLTEWYEHVQQRAAGVSA